MGCDGGTIPTRDELVRVKRKPEQKDKDSIRAVKWQHCAITQEPLRQPIVACEMGRLYNKESVLEFLLDRSKFEQAQNFQHIRGLKDIKELKLTDNPAYVARDNDKGDSYNDKQTSPYICPVVGVEMNGKHRFCFVWSCGCVFSERALKEVKTDVCHKCGKHFQKSDIVILNGAEEDASEMASRMEARRLVAKQQKKAKKHKADEAAGSTTSNDTSNGESVSKQAKLQPAAGKGKSLANGSSDQKSKLTNGKLNGETVKPRSIQQDPTTSNVYKSLFTTCEKAKNQKQGNWVTFNPQYF